MNIEINLFWGIIIGILVSILFARIYSTIAGAIGNVVRISMKSLYLKLKNMADYPIKLHYEFK